MLRKIMFEYFIYLIAIINLYILYCHKSSSLPSYHLIIKDPKFSTLEPHQSYPKRQHSINYTKLVNITNFKFLKNPQICDNNSILLIIVVPSRPVNYKRRCAIRETWGQVNDAVKIVFTLGTQKNRKMEAKIRNESTTFNDIIQGNFLDSYRNLTYKHVMGLKWVAHHCGKARYLAKADDDTFVHIRNLIKFLVRELSPWGTKDLIGCLVWTNMKVIRDQASKWYVPKEVYAPEEYPIYCSGMFIIYSQDVVPLLVEQSETTNYFFIDDVYVTGTLVEQLGLIHTNLSPLAIHFPGVKCDKLLEDPAALVRDFIFGPMNVKLENMRRLWNSTLTQH